MKKLYFCFIFCSLIFFTACGSQSYLQSQGQVEGGQDYDQDSSQDSSQSTDASSLDTSGESGTSGLSDSSSQIYVEVAGAVSHPDVYALKEGSRVVDAIKLAGGLLPEADTQDLNQARLLTDGEKIYVYTDAELSELEAVEHEDSLININTADAEALMTLPGLGQSKADAIIAYRQTNGNFTAIEDIMKVQGIKEGTYSQFSDKIKV